MSNAMRRTVSLSRPEADYRKPVFLGGERVPMADGQEWALPGPGQLGEAGPQRDEVAAIVRAIGEAEDDGERRRGELALAIKLLSINYDLTPETFQTILGFGSAEPAPATMRAAFRGLACRHAEALWPRKEVPNMPRAHRPRLPVFRFWHAGQRSERTC